MGYVGYFVVFVGLVVFRGFALQQLWSWFITPFGLPGLNIAWALGISQVFSLMVGASADKQKSISDLFIAAFFLPLAALLIGFVVHLFM